MANQKTPDGKNIPLLNMMRKAGIEITRENYIECNYLGDVPEEWGPEQEAALPAFLQDWSQFGLPTLNEDAVATSAMGGSSSTPGTGLIDTYDPILRAKENKKRLRDILRKTKFL